MQKIKRLLKHSLLVIAGLFLLASIAVVGLVTFVDPNQFKNTIENEIHSRFGHSVLIKGPLAWRLFPMPALEIQDIVLQNSAPFKDALFSIEKTHVRLEVWPLLIGKFWLDVELNELRLSLKKLASGKTNWETLLRANPNASSRSHVMLSGIKINNARILYQDELLNKRYKVNHLNLKADKLLRAIMGSVTPFNLMFDLQESKTQLGTFSLKAEWFLKHATGGVRIEKFSLKINPNNRKSTKIKGELDLDNLHRNLSAQGLLHSEYFDVDSLLIALGLTQSPIFIPIDNLKTNFVYNDQSFHFDNILINIKDHGILTGQLKGRLENTLKDSTFTGKLSSPKLQLPTLSIHNLQVPFSLMNGVLQMAPIDFQINQSKQIANINLNLTEALPNLSLNYTGEPFEIANVLELFSTQELSGLTQLDLNISTRGKTLNTLQQNLSGTARVRMTNGTLQELDLKTLLQEALASTHQLLSSISQQESFDKSALISQGVNAFEKTSNFSKGQTSFEQLTANFTATNGLIHNTDLRIIDPAFEVTGSGKVQLPQNTLQYHAKAKLMENPYPADDKIATHLFTIPVPIDIRGSLSKPKVRPDLKTYLNDSLELIQKNALQRLINRTVEKVFNRLIPE